MFNQQQEYKNVGYGSKDGDRTWVMARSLVFSKTLNAPSDGVMAPVSRTGVAAGEQEKKKARG